MSHSNFEVISQFVASDLAAVDAVILSSAHDKFPLIKVLLQHIISAGGKRLRPILTLACAKLLAYKGNGHIAMAAAVEFIHTATLLHDDVVDESRLRRGVPTANATWGNKTSILVGDFLLSQAFQLMVKEGNLKILDLLSNASAIIAEGEVMQLASINDISMSEEQYLYIIEAKTAVLFAAACQIGPLLVGASSDLCHALKSFGLYLGISFQIIDDVLDYNANASQLGKSLGDDFKEGKITLPVIYCYHHATPEDKQFWERTMTSLDQTAEDFVTAQKLLAKYNALEYSIQKAKHYLSLAHSALSPFPDSDYKNLLLDILAFSEKRLY